MRMNLRLPDDSEAAKEVKRRLRRKSGNASQFVRDAIDFYLEYRDALPRLHEAFVSLSRNYERLKAGGVVAEEDERESQMPDEIVVNFGKLVPKGRYYT
jgi:hypothetical protein